MKKPIIGIMLVDPTGIGPEIIVKSLTLPEIYQQCVGVVVKRNFLNRKKPHRLSLVKCLAYGVFCS